MKHKKAIKLFFDYLDKYEVYEELIDAVRNAHSYGDISDDDYDCLIKNWDDLVEIHDNDLSSYCDKADDLTSKMIDAVTRIVKQYGIIRTDDTKQKSPIYAYIYDYNLERVDEYKILAITILDDCLAILPTMEAKTYDITLNISDEELLKDADWQTVTNGDVCLLSTMYEICSNLNEYLK